MIEILVAVIGVIGPPIAALIVTKQNRWGRRVSDMIAIREKLPPGDGRTALEASIQSEAERLAAFSRSYPISVYAGAGYIIIGTGLSLIRAVESITGSPHLSDGGNDSLTLYIVAFLVGGVIPLVIGAVGANKELNQRRRVVYKAISRDGDE